MQISLNKNSDVSLQLQLSDQIVFLVTTGKLRSGEQLPSVRSLARRLAIHHNTVSKAYQDLVRRGWLRGKHGSRLHVGHSERRIPLKQNADLDDLINRSIQ